MDQHRLAATNGSRYDACAAGRPPRLVVEEALDGFVDGFYRQANLAADFHKTEDVFIQLNLAPGADADAVVAGFGGRRGHPVWIAPRRMAELREAPPEHPRGLRGWMQDRSWKVDTLETGDPSVLEDFDRREDAEGKGNHR